MIIHHLDGSNCNLWPLVRVKLKWHPLAAHAMAFERVSIAYTFYMYNELGVNA